MGFRSAITPTRLAAAAELVLDDTRNYAAGASATFDMDPDLFGGFDPLRVELRSLGFAWMMAEARIFPPQSTSVNDALIHKALDSFRGFLPVQPIGGRLAVKITNVDTFAADMQVRVYRLRGVRNFSDLIRSAVDLPRSRSTNISAGNTGTTDIKGSASIAERLTGFVTVDQNYDVVVRWREAVSTTLLQVDETIAAGVTANDPTVIDVPWKGAGAAQVRVTNNGAATAALVASFGVVPLR